MGLTLKQEIAEREYKKYENITDSFTFEEGKTYTLASMDRLSSKVLTHIWKRKQILKDVVAYYKEGTESKEKEDALQKRLNENDEYFMNLTNIDKEKFIEFFEHTSDKLAKTPAWQSYHMLYVELLGVGLKKQINDSISRTQEMEEKVKTYEEKEKRKNEVGEKFSRKYPPERAKEILNDYKVKTEELKKLEDEKKAIENERVEALKRYTSRVEKRNELYDKADKASAQASDIVSEQNRLKDFVKDMEEHKDDLAALKKNHEDGIQAHKDSIQAYENAKKDLEDLKTSRKGVVDSYFNTRSEFFTWGENYGNINLETKTDEEKKASENLIRNIRAHKKRGIIGSFSDEIDKLRNDPEFKLGECIYGKEDSKLREKYPILDWIKNYTELKKESEELQARQAEEAERSTEEKTEDGVENENAEEIANADVENAEEIAGDDVENENTEKEPIEIGEVEVVEGETTYETLLNAMYDDLDKIDDVHWDEITNTEEKFTDDVRKIYDTFTNELNNFSDEADAKKNEIAEQEKKVVEREKKVAEQEKKITECAENITNTKSEYLNTIRKLYDKKVQDKVYSWDVPLDRSNPLTYQQQAVEKINELQTKIDEKRKERDQYKKEAEKIPQEELDKERAEYWNRVDNDWKTRGSDKTKEIDAKKLEIAQITPVYNGLITARDEYNKVREEYNKVREETFKYVPKEIDDLQPGIKQQANEWLKKAQTYADKHKNSKEFDAMINALKMAADWPDIKKYT